MSKWVKGTFSYVCVYMYTQYATYLRRHVTSPMHIYSWSFGAKCFSLLVTSIMKQSSLRRWQLQSLAHCTMHTSRSTCTWNILFSLQHVHFSKASDKYEAKFPTKMRAADRAWLTTHTSRSTCIRELTCTYSLACSSACWKHDPKIRS